MQIKTLLSSSLGATTPNQPGVLSQNYSAREQENVTSMWRHMWTQLEFVTSSCLNFFSGDQGKNASYSFEMYLQHSSQFKDAIKESRGTIGYVATFWKQPQYRHCIRSILQWQEGPHFQRNWNMKQSPPTYPPIYPSIPPSHPSIHPSWSILYHVSIISVFMNCYVLAKCPWEARILTLWFPDYGIIGRWYNL